VPYALTITASSMFWLAVLSFLAGMATAGLIGVGLWALRMLREIAGRLK